MIKMNSLGAFRSLNNKYSEYRKEFKNSSYNPKRQSLDDSSGCLNETKKSNLLPGTTKSTGPLELQHWNLPPRYMEIFENTSDIFKEIQLKCIKLCNNNRH